ncbi:MAG TPA: hypothetical protein VGN57_14425 [Pirellulaceae bacterium]|jgi:hypothetical protein|nr:hypothetical protein [Pirellulaceae bacterium]
MKVLLSPLAGVALRIFATACALLATVSSSTIAQPPAASKAPIPAAPKQVDRSWNETIRIATKHAGQGAAADDEFLYGISNEAVAKLDRETGELIALSKGEAAHLNAGSFVDGKLILAHSNYPRQPETSQVMSLDPATMKLTVVHDFGESDGSLVWVLRHQGQWWANFAFYGDEYEKSYLARFDDDWKELQRWTYPPQLLDQLHEASLSGGIWREGAFLATGHDDKILFRLGVPANGKRLELLGSEKIAFTGQGFAQDPLTDGLVGIDRAKRQIVFVEEGE